MSYYSSFWLDYATGRVTLGARWRDQLAGPEAAPLPSAHVDAHEMAAWLHLSEAQRWATVETYSADAPPTVRPTAGALRHGGG